MVGSLSEWFHVSFDQNSIHIKIDPEGREKRTDSLEWEDIIRVCFKTGNFLTSDEIYIFVVSRNESYLIPTEADGATDLWGEIIERKLFDAKLAIEVATANPDELFCWPEGHIKHDQ